MAEQATIVLDVPALVDQPAVGTSCCVTSAEALIAQELWMLPGVEDAEIDPRQGLVRVRFDPAVVTAEAIASALQDVGYPPVRTLPAAP